MPGATALVPIDGNSSASSALTLIAAFPLRFPAVTGPPAVPPGALPVPFEGKDVPALATGLPCESSTGKLAGFTGVPSPDVPPEPKILRVPRLNGPSNQSKPSSFRLFCETSTNFASISTCLGTARFIPSTIASTRSKLS